MRFFKTMTLNWHTQLTLDLVHDTHPEHRQSFCEAGTPKHGIDQTNLVYYELFSDDFVLDQMTLGQIHDTLQGDKQSLCEE